MRAGREFSGCKFVLLFLIVIVTVTAPKCIEAQGQTGVVYVGANTFPCTGPGVASALAAAAVPPGGLVNARGCQGTFTGAAWNVGIWNNSKEAGVILLLGPGTWNMGSNTITVSPHSAIFGPNRDLLNFVWSGDVDGIVTPIASTQGIGPAGNVTLYGFQAINGSLATSSRAVLHLFDCPRCSIENVTVSFDSTAASAGIRLDPQTGSTQFGTWSGTIRNVTIQRLNQNGTASSGQIGLDLNGNTTLGNAQSGDIALWTVDGLWVEGQTTNIRIFGGSHNKFLSGMVLGGGTNISISGSATVGSDNNWFNLRLDQFKTQHVNIDANSHFNFFMGGTEGPATPFGTDTTGDNVKLMSTGGTGGLYQFGSIRSCAGTNPCSNSQQFSSYAVYDGGATYRLGGGTLTITGFPFSAINSYGCFAWDVTNSSNAVTAANNSGSSVTFAGAGSDLIRFLCLGN